MRYHPCLSYVVVTKISCCPSTQESNRVFSNLDFTHSIWTYPIEASESTPVILKPSEQLLINFICKRWSKLDLHAHFRKTSRWHYHSFQTSLNRMAISLTGFNNRQIWFPAWTYGEFEDCLWQSRLGHPLVSSRCTKFPYAWRKSLFLVIIYKPKSANTTSFDLWCVPIKISTWPFSIFKCCSHALFYF